MSLHKLYSIIDYLKKELSSETSHFYTNKTEFTETVKELYKDEYTKYPAVFTVIFNANFNMDSINRLEFMLSMANKVEDKDIAEHDASVVVGQRLVDEIVKPQLKK